MFVLAELQYIIRIEPRRFGKDMKKEITDELNRKFANKVGLCVNSEVFFCDFYFVCPQVIHNVGLCIALYDITYVGDSYILPGDGASHTKGELSHTRPGRRIDFSSRFPCGWRNYFNKKDVELHSSVDRRYMLCIMLSVIKQL